MGEITYGECVWFDLSFAVMSKYLHPITLVDTEWVAKNYQKPNIRLVEVNKNPDLYSRGHIPNAIHWHPDWRDYKNRNLLVGRRLAFLSARLLNVTEHTTVVFYGAEHNWWASLAFWIFKRFGHADCRLLDGGREKWIAEGRELSFDVPDFPETDYFLSEQLKKRTTNFRATTAELIAHLNNGKTVIDVRTPEEYCGEAVYVSQAYKNMLPPEKGHIPSAVHIHWKDLLNADGTFRSRECLKDIFLKADVDLQDDIIVYCSVGERSAHTWFALRYLLGCLNVLNYDASWLEWGSDPMLPRFIGEDPGEFPIAFKQDLQVPEL